MYPKLARAITFLVVLLMSLEIFGASVDAIPPSSDHTLTIHSQKRPSSLFDNLFLQKAVEESEKTEEEKDGLPRVLLIDFSRMAFSLSFYYTPQIQLAVPTFQYDVRPPLHQLNCLFLI